ncbi:MAG: hypothetical protein C4341_03960 [Armatimonadota bacterium]
MIPFEEALESVRAWSRNVDPMGVERVSLADAIGRVLATDAVADAPYPRFDNSAVDGFAIGCAEDGRAGAALRVVARVRAGDPPLTSPIAAGTAVRIFTGAPVPAGTWGIVMQEDVTLLDDLVVLVKVAAQEGQHVRRAGSDIKSGMTTVGAGERINAGHVALLATLGEPEPEVRARVPVAVLTTGDELVPAHQSPAPGQIRDSNGPMLFALAQGIGCAVSPPSHVLDSGEELERAICEATSSHRIVLITGGASVGDHDFVPSVIRRRGDVSFHGVAIRPGKPLLFASVGGTALFGLPGNPAATFVGFHLFVRECVAGMQRERYEPRWVAVQYTEQHEACERDDFIRATLDWGASPPEARAVQEQGSFALRSLAEADCLVRIPAHAEHQPGQLRKALLLPERQG